MISFIADLLTSGDPAQVVAGLLLLIGGGSFAVCGTALSFIDSKEHRLPNRIIYPWAGLTLGILVLTALLLGDLPGLARAVLAGLAWGLGFLAIRLVHPPSLGIGDAKLAVVLGMYSGFMGWSTFGAAIVFSFVLGGLISLGLLVFTKADRSSRIPFGPYLILGTAVALMLS